jgi:hypothetical protein
MYMVFWYESGTGEKRMEGPFKTKAEAEKAPFGYLYPPETKSITIFQV